MKNVLVACECSGAVRRAFAKRGWNAWSCDLKPSEDHSDHHFQGDMFEFIGSTSWDLVIAHPPCTYIAVSGNRWYAGTQKRADGIAFVEKIWTLSTYRGPLAIENPVGVLPTQSILGKASQYIQPWMFGHGETKNTGLWLRGLPILYPTNVVEGRENRVWKMGPSPERATNRSRTYDGIANAMADQWTAFLEQSK